MPALSYYKCHPYHSPTTSQMDISVEERLELNSKHTEPRIQLGHFSSTFFRKRLFANAKVTSSTVRIKQDICHPIIGAQCHDIIKISIASLISDITSRYIRIFCIHNETISLIRRCSSPSVSRIDISKTYVGFGIISLDLVHLKRWTEHPGDSQRPLTLSRATRWNLADMCTNITGKYLRCNGVGSICTCILAWTNPPLKYLHCGPRSYRGIGTFDIFPPSNVKIELRPYHAQ
jgi:hypothetical protein